MKYLQPKSPDSTRFYYIDYSKLVGSDQISSFTINNTSGTCQVTRTVFNNYAVGFIITEGLANEIDTFSLTINTAAGQIFPDNATLFVIANEDDLDFSLVTKDTIIEYAFQDLRISGYIFDKSPQMLSAMLSRLDVMMREWRLKQMDVGYNHPLKIGQSEFNDIAGIEDGLTAMVATCLAKEYLDGIGKSLTPNFIARYNKAYNYIYAKYYGVPYSVLTANTPRGAGGKLYSVYFPFQLLQASTTEASLLAGLNNGNTQFIKAGIWDESQWDNASWG